MKSFIKNTSSTFIRIARIQINSPLRNKNLYPDHYYKITCHFDEIYGAGSYGVNDRILEIYTGTTDNYYLTNVASFYVKKVSEDGIDYIDIATTSPNNYTNIHVNVETVNEGSVTLYREDAVQSEYTRIYFFSTNLQYVLNGMAYFYLGSSQNMNITVPKNVVRITDVNNGVVGYVTNSGDTKNGNNTSFTLSVSGTDSDNARTFNVSAKVNCNILVEVL